MYTLTVYLNFISFVFAKLPSIFYSNIAITFSSSAAIPSIFNVPTRVFILDIFLSFKSFLILIPIPKITLT